MDIICNGSKKKNIIKDLEIAISENRITYFNDLYYFNGKLENIFIMIIEGVFRYVTYSYYPEMLRILKTRDYKYNPIIISSQDGIYLSNKFYTRKLTIYELTNEYVTYSNQGEFQISFKSDVEYNELLELYNLHIIEKMEI